jgi:hydrogenase maturation factor
LHYVFGQCGRGSSDRTSRRQSGAVETDGGVEVVSVALVAAKAGDVVLVHAKEAIAKLDD